MKTTIIAVLFSLLIGEFSAFATVYNSDGSAASVILNQTLASNGDTITLPAGTFTWSVPVVINKAIKLQGAGAGRIVARSRSSVAFGTGTKTFTITTSTLAADSIISSLTAGTTLRIWQLDKDKDSVYMLGTLSSLSGSTLTVNVATSTGTGTIGTWLIATEPSTVIVHNYASAASNPAENDQLVNLTENTNGSVEMSGIYFTHGGSANCQTTNFSYTSSGKPILLHDCWFYNKAALGDFHTYSTNRGVVYNCSFSWSYFAQSNSQAMHWQANSRTEVWSAPSTMGANDTTGASNLYVEDCDFHGGIGVSDFDANTKVVWRYCVMDNSGLASHGYDTGPYGNRHWEIYNNRFEFTNAGDCDGSQTLGIVNFALLRGGTGVITDNYFENITSCAWGDKPELQFGVWNLGRWCQSPGAYDADDSCVPHYPSPRQFGFGYVTGTGKDGHGLSTEGGIYVGDSEPAYVWNNTGFTPAIQITTDGTPCVTNQYGHVPDNPNDYIQAGRDYFVGTAKPGYQKYTYPHPLRSVTSPPPPQNLHTM